MEAVVEWGPQQQHQEAQDLQGVERLPAQRQAHHPDHHRPQAVQHHARGGADLLGDAHAGEVEKGDAERVAKERHQDERLPADLAEGVQRVLQHVPGVRAEAARGDEVHGDEQEGKDEEAKQACQRKGEGDHYDLNSPSNHLYT